MSASLVWSNLTAYSLQILLLVAVAAFVPALVRLGPGGAPPSARLLYWRLLLMACLALPLIRPWRQDVVAVDVQVSTVVTNVAPAQRASRGLPVTEIALFALAAGAAVRLAWLGVGFWRLGRYRRGARPLGRMGRPLGPVPLLVSDEVAGPVTFGFLRPVILLPARFESLPAAMQEGILCHEMLHVERHDWLFTLVEELIRAVFWFHPAIWWLLGQIQLTREQTVDRRVIEMTQARDPYVDALLAMAGAAAAPADLALAPTFLRKRHLKQRVVEILQEVGMSKKRLVSAFAAGLAMLAAACWMVTAEFPLAAAPQTVADAAGVAVDTNGAQLMHRMPVAYPSAAQVQRVEGTVVARVQVDAKGEVSDAAIVSGPDALRKAVLESVLGWHFARSEAGMTRTVSVAFALPKDAPPPQRVAEPVRPPAGISVPAQLRSISIAGLSDQAREELMAKLPVHEGDSIGPDTARAVSLAVREFDPHLSSSLGRNPDGTGVLRIVANSPRAESAAAPAAPLKIGGNMQAKNLVSQARPVYPPEAKQARIQGKVQLKAIIGAEGTVQNLEVVSGPPELIQSALDAVKQWVYQPTLLNGNPVAVETTIDVNYTLSR
jgi:TonB family protein